MRAARGHVQPATQKFNAAPKATGTSSARRDVQPFEACLWRAVMYKVIDFRSRVACECVRDVFMWTHCVSAVQFLQEGVVCAFGEATLLIDKSQHAQFL